MQKDVAGLELSGASERAAADYHAAVEAFHRYAGDCVGLLDAAIADSPDFVMAHVLKAHLTLVGGNAEVARIGQDALEIARTLPQTEREKGHVLAAGHMAEGRIQDAGRVLEDVAIRFPLDSVALQAGGLVDFLTGDARMLRDRVARALPAWSPDRPFYHAVLGMLAFGLQETGLYGRAEAVGRQAIDLDSRNGWARHAVAHVLEMQDRRADGVAWMRGDIPAWTDGSFFAVHNWWHLALFHLGLGEIDKVLEIYDGPIFGRPSGMAFDLVDAAALLWRLHLRGDDVGARWTALADAYEAKGEWGGYAFDDFHAMMAFTAAGRADAARALLEAQGGVTADNRYFVAEVGLPAMQAVHAFGEGRYGETTALLRGVRNHAHRFGGSHAQRDVIDLTLIEAARRGGDFGLESALVAEREGARP